MQLLSNLLNRNSASEYDNAALANKFAHPALLLLPSPLSTSVKFMPSWGPSHGPEQFIFGGLAASDFPPVVLTGLRDDTLRIWCER